MIETDRPRAKTVVLIVEDEPSVRQTLCAFLENDGFTAYSAETAEAAQKILAAKHIDAVVLEVELPHTGERHKSGLDFLTDLRLKQEYLTLPVLIFTGQPLIGRDEDLVRRHGAHVVRKPQHYRTLAQQLDRLTQTA